jgi:hypothetical protein
MVGIFLHPYFQCSDRLGKHPVSAKNQGGPKAALAISMSKPTCHLAVGDKDC